MGRKLRALWKALVTPPFKIRITDEWILFFTGLGGFIPITLGVALLIASYLGEHPLELVSIPIGALWLYVFVRASEIVKEEDP